MSKLRGWGEGDEYVCEVRGVGAVSVLGCVREGEHMSEVGGGGCRGSVGGWEVALPPYETITGGCFLLPMGRAV